MQRGRRRPSDSRPGILPRGVSCASPSNRETAAFGNEALRRRLTLRMTGTTDKVGRLDVAAFKAGRSGFQAAS
jgi:hypothetical protein